MQRPASGGATAGRPGGGAMRGPGMAMFGVAAKPRNFKDSLKRLVKEIRKDGVKIYVVFGLLIASVISGIFGPKLMGRATNLILYGFIGKKLPAGVPRSVIIANAKTHGYGQFANALNNPDLIPGVGVNFHKVASILILTLCLYIVSSFLSWVQLYTMAGITQRTTYRLREQAEQKIGKLPLSYFDTGSRGDILSRVTNDIDNIGTSLQQGFSQTFNSILTVIAVLAIMVWISWILALVSLVAVPLSMLASVRIAKRSQKEFVKQWDWTGKLNGHVEEMHTGHSLIKVFGRRHQAIEDFKNLNENLYKSSFLAQFISGVIQPTTQFISNLIYVAIAVIGGWRVATGSMSLGDVQAFIQYSRQFGMPLSQLAGLMNTIQSGVASAERVYEFLDAVEEKPDAPSRTLDRAVGGVEFQNVSFRYVEDQPLIENFNLKVAPGQTVAIVGPTGAGKTTLVNLIMRFYEVNSGTITVDGIDIRELSRDDLRKQFGMVLQDTWLFTGSMRENIGYGSSNPTEEKVIAAAKAANIDHFLRSLPAGYDSPLTDDNSTVSNGERQLLTIARAFMADPAILILDEATSSVDTRTEYLVQKAMSQLRHGRTSFVIAHRLSTIIDADTILVMDNGSLVEQGNHHELMAKKGFYYNLYQSQFAKAISE
jgi:ATP-binding cassette subfamily B protein